MNSGLTELAAIANLVTAIAVLGGAVVVVLVGWELRAVIRRVHGMLDKVNGDLSPLVRNVREISDDVRGVTNSIRDDVERVNGAVTAVTDGVQRALAVSEERLGQMNALLEVVQDEAEQLFVTTASTVRGVRRGTEAFRGRGGTDLASDELDAAEEADATTKQEEEDGHDNRPESAAPALPPGPRVRPRPGHRRRA
jgi:uncharacterized protein YoxC